MGLQEHPKLDWSNGWGPVMMWNEARGDMNMRRIGWSWANAKLGTNNRIIFKCMFIQWHHQVLIEGP